MKAEDGIWHNLKTENSSVALKRPDLLSILVQAEMVMIWIKSSQLPEQLWKRQNIATSIKQKMYVYIV